MMTMDLAMLPASPDALDMPGEVTGSLTTAPNFWTQDARPANDDGFGFLARQYGDRRGALLATAKAQVSSLRKLTALRRVNEDLQNCFHQLERSLAADVAGLNLVFADEPGTGHEKLSLGWSSSGLTQVLPVSSTGISAFEFMLNDIRAGEGAVLHVHLVAREQQSVIDRWSVPLEAVNAGWTMFCLTRPLIGPTSTLEVRLDVECDADVHLALALGGRPTIGVFQPRNPVANVAASDCGLAMRVWCGDAHSAYGRHGNAHVADGRAVSPSGLTEVPLSPSLIAEVVQVPIPGALFDFNPVTWIPYRVAVGCHPQAEGLTIASLPLPAGRIGGINSLAEVGNALSRPVEFAMILTDDAERVKGLLDGSLNFGSSEAWSGWVTAEHGQPAALGLRLSRVQPSAAVLYLATRMQVPGNKDYAWARFRSINLLMDARS